MTDSDLDDVDKGGDASAAAAAAVAVGVADFAHVRTLSAEQLLGFVSQSLSVGFGRRY